MFAKMSHEGAEKASEIRQDLEVEAVLSMQAVKLEVRKSAETERKALVAAVAGTTTHTVTLLLLLALQLSLKLGFQLLLSPAACAAGKSRWVGKRRRPPECNLENNPKQDKP
jgi:hypothetical protein